MAVRVNVAEDDAASSDDHVRLNDGRVLAAPRGVGEMIKRLEAVACMMQCGWNAHVRTYGVLLCTIGTEEGNFWSEQVARWVVRSSKIELVGVLTHV
jgi:hypothetical protein